MLHSLRLKSLNQPILTATVLDHQLQDGLVAEHEFDRMRYVVRKLFYLKLQIHAIEAELSLPLPADVSGLACTSASARGRSRMLRHKPLLKFNAVTA